MVDVSQEEKSTAKLARRISKGSASDQVGGVLIGIEPYLSPTVMAPIPAERS